MNKLEFLLAVAIIPAILLVVLCLFYREARLRRIVVLWVSLTYGASVVTAYQFARGPGLVVVIFLSSYLIQLFAPMLHIAILKYSSNSLGEGRFAGMLFGFSFLFVASLFLVAAVAIHAG